MPRHQHTSDLEDHLGYWLRYVSNHVSHAFALKVEARGVTVAEWVLMREMLNSGAANPSQLAQRLGQSRGAVSKLIDRVCQKGLVVRSHSDNDRRFQNVELTAAGKALVPVLARYADDNDHEYFGHLTKQQRNALIDMLRGMVARHGWKDLPTD